MTLFRSEGANYDETADEGTLPSDVRRGYQGLFSSTGVLPSSDSPLVEGAGDFTYTVHTGYWVTSRGGSDGYHYWGNVGDLSVPTSVAPAAGLSRIDIIYALHPSYSENGDTTSTPVVDVMQGVEASSPVAPSLPVGALELARNTMTSSATDTAGSGNTITQSSQRAALRAGAEVRATGSGAFSASGGPTTSSALAVKGAGQVAVRVNLGNVTCPSGVQNTVVGTLTEPFRPTAGSGAWVAWSSQGAVLGTTATNGVTAITWASAALSGNSIIISAHWPL